jgi:hypothetical protein
MRDKVNVFYYPSMVADSATLKRSILLFDELHFIDRPSFTFGNFGTIGTASPLRAYEKSFREHGIPLYVHAPHDGPVEGEFLEQVKNDVNDCEFLRRFQNGLEESAVFRNQQITPGNYGEVGNQDDLAKALISVNLDADIKHPAPMDLFSDKDINPFRCKTQTERAKALVTHALTCSTMMNFALDVSQHEGITPLADAVPYQSLLSAKYARAARAVENTVSKIQLTDLSFAIFDELLPAECLDKLSFKDVVNYRKESEKARESFLEQLSALHAKQGSLEKGGDYIGAIKKIIVTEIIPAATKFKHQIDGVYSKLFGSLATSALVSLGGGSAALQIFGDLSWPNLLHLAGFTGAAIGKAAIEARQAIGALHRECAISYVLKLDK